MATNDTEGRAKALRERVHEDYADPWDFKELPELVGVVESLSWVKADGEWKAVATIKEVEGPVDARKRYAVWLSQVALFNRFRDLDVAEGELVAIRYMGQGEPAKPGLSGAHRFRVEAHRPGRRFSWEHGRNEAAVDQYEPPPEAEAMPEGEDHDAAMAGYKPPVADDDDSIPF